MIIDKINVERLSFGKAKNDTPVRPDRYRPKAFQITFELVKTKGRLRYVLDSRRRIEGGQDQAKPPQHILRELAPIVVFIKPVQALVAERLDHQSHIYAAFCQMSIDI